MKQKTLLIAMIAFAMSIFTAEDAFAKKGGNGKGKALGHQKNAQKHAHKRAMKQQRDMGWAEAQQRSRNDGRVVVRDRNYQYEQERVARERAIQRDREIQWQRDQQRQDEIARQRQWEQQQQQQQEQQQQPMGGGGGLGEILGGLLGGGALNGIF